MSNIVFATHNDNKLRELKQILKPLNLNIISALEAGVNMDDFEETGATFEENARLKAKYVYNSTGIITIADDSGLCVDALNGEPGILSARYSGKDSKSNIEKLLKKIDGIDMNLRTARFVCAICCFLSSEDIFEVRGECEGYIGFDCIGENGFGYDPIFIVDGVRTFAQLSSEEKNMISHRGKALRLLKKELEIVLKNS